jgi:hypothetical protein
MAGILDFVLIPETLTIKACIIKKLNIELYNINQIKFCAIFQFQYSFSHGKIVKTIQKNDENIIRTQK